MPSARAIEGCLLGTAIGDALGLPYEGLSPGRVGDNARAARPLSPGVRPGHGVGRYRTRLHDGPGPDRCWQRRFGLRARTGRPIAPLAHPAARGHRPGDSPRDQVKLSVGVLLGRSGVFSAGNGPGQGAAAILGTAIDDREVPRWFRSRRRRGSRTPIPKPSSGRWPSRWRHDARRSSDRLALAEFVQQLAELLADQPADEFLELVRLAAASASRGETAPLFAQSLGLSRGVSGYIYHTVPVALKSVAAPPARFPRRHRRRDCLRGRRRHDGGHPGRHRRRRSRQGRGLPAEWWLSRLWEWPRSVGLIELPYCRTLCCLAQAACSGRPPAAGSGVLTRNVLCRPIVLFLRLSPLAAAVLSWSLKARRLHRPAPGPLPQLRRLRP